VKITVDTAAGLLRREDGSSVQETPLYSTEGFEVLSELWLRVGWNQKYTYTFSWLGRPVVQLPDDMLRTQEAIYSVRPDVIIETGVAHGGSLVFYASLCKSMGSGRVIGVDIEIRPHNRTAIERHELSDYITLIEGSSTDPSVLQQVRSSVRPHESVLVLLDSCHTKRHVADELEAYAPLVSEGSYIVATDGIMRFVSDAPRGNPAWATDNPEAAAREFLKSHPEFAPQPPAWPFNESQLRSNVTHWPGAWLRRKSRSDPRPTPQDSASHKPCEPPIL
jgi:cephalosporin hydroxylase